MATTASPEVRTQWVAHPNYLVCPQGHLLRHFEKGEGPARGWRGDLRHLAGHAFFRCNTCQPVSFFFAVFVREPSPIVLGYLIAEEDFRWWQGDGGQVTLPTLEMLHRLHDPTGRSHNPEWRPVL